MNNFVGVCSLKTIFLWFIELLAVSRFSFAVEKNASFLVFGEHLVNGKERTASDRRK